MSWKYALYIPLFLFLAVVLWFAFLSATSKRPDNLGLVDGHLAPCPSSPNCVCSQNADADHQIAPIQVGDEKDPMARLASVIGGMSGAKVITTKANYLHAEFTSFVFHFVDDVEFLFDPETKLLHCRSASRVGHSDLGVNRKRIEAIRKAFATK
ncbi:MAG: DUF1499 domain-containing protein [Candidatus Acidiferrum sp.]